MRLSDYLNLPREDYTTRREPPAVCYICGGDVPEGSFYAAVCEKRECRDADMRRG